MNKIPKVIHYCWFGGNEKPDIVRRCIKSWQKFLPEYEIKEWNESNTGFIKHPYLDAALACKKWAFAADYARFFILYKYGGIYLDTDEELFANLDSFLKFDMFLGFERYGTSISPMGGVIGAGRENKTIAAILKTYDETDFVLEKGIFDTTPITARLKKIFAENYNLPNDFDGLSIFNFEENSAIFPANYFCEYTGVETIAKHHYAFSWKKDTLLPKYRIFRDPISSTHCFSIYYVPRNELPENLNAKLLLRLPFFGHVVLLVREPI